MRGSGLVDEVIGLSHRRSRVQIPSTLQGGWEGYVIKVRVQMLSNCPWLHYSINYPGAAACSGVYFLKGDSGNGTAHTLIYMSV